MHQSMWWFIGAMILGIVEVMTLELTLLMFAGGAIAAGAAALLGAEVWVSIVVFCVVSVLLIFAHRPYLQKFLRMRTRVVETNVAALVGRPAVALDDITGTSGRVKLSGEVWTARVGEGADAVPEGSEVTVVAIQGATAIVAAEKE